MKHLSLIAATGAVFLLAAAGPDKPRERRKAPPADTAIGCIDQSGETYLLTGDRQLKTRYTLHGAGFKDDNFARYLGHKVRVTGKVESGDTFRVKQIESLSETCEPAGQEP